MDALPSPDLPLDELMASLPAGPGLRRAAFPERWSQGRATFGGLVIGALARAMESEIAGGERALRSLTAELCAPTAAGEAELRMETLRAGNNVSTLACRLEQGGETRAHAVGVLGSARSLDLDGVHLEPPRHRGWRELPPMPMEAPFAPDFASQWEFRTAGPFPFSGATEPAGEGWIRPKHRGARRDAAYLAACVDAWWPAFFARAEAPRPVATVAFTLEICGGFEGLDPEAPLLFRSRDVAIRQGYVVEMRELWGEDGRLLALNQQTFAIVK